MRDGRQSELLAEKHGAVDGIVRQDRDTVATLEHQAGDRWPHRTVEALVLKLHFVNAKDEALEDFLALEKLYAPGHTL